jgi:uncharacterized protein YjbI with pentapeptide repeats
MRAGARTERAGPALAGALLLALLLVPAPGQGGDVNISGEINSSTTCADFCGENNCGPETTVTINGERCRGGADGGEKRVHCTEESLEKEHSFIDNAMPTTFSFKGLGCKCAKDRNMVYLSCPSGVDASSGDIGRTIDFRYAKLENVKFDGANLEKAKFDHAVCKGCSFVGAEMSGADMSFAKMDNSNFSGAGLEGAGMDFMKANGGNFTSANLKDVSADHGKFNGASFTGATMSDFDSDFGHFNGADLSDAVLSGASLTFAAMKGADLSRANLDSADLSYAGFSGATGFQSATCSGATFEFMTCPSGKSVGVFQKGCDPSESCAA